MRVWLTSWRQPKRDEKERRDQFNKELYSLAAMLPSLDVRNITRKSILACTREYLRQLQWREMKLRSLWLEARPAQGTEAGNEANVKKLEELLDPIRNGMGAFFPELEDGLEQRPDSALDDSKEGVESVD